MTAGPGSGVPVILVSAYDGDPAEERARMEELAELSLSAGARVVGSMMQRRPRDAGPLLLGKGKLAELGGMCRKLGAAAAVIRQDLTPPQQKHIEDSLPCAVVDRTALILDIFSRHARSREGKLQVELARLMYRLPRLRGRGREMSRLGGAGRTAGGGVGGARFTRGPGEQELEYGKRRVRDRISRLKKEIEDLRSRRSHQREKRRDRAMPSVVLVGYTNAGKSTLFKGLTRRATLVRQQMFSTLDPKSSLVRLPGGGRALISDTVGFISDLPGNLRVAFRATLEEMAEADALIHVVDSSSPVFAEQVRTVIGEVAELGAAEVPRLTVFNKEDLSGHTAAVLRAMEAGEPGAVIASAREGTGLDAAMERLEQLLRETYWKKVTWESPSGEIRAELVRLGASFKESPGGREGDEGPIEAWVSSAQAARLAGISGGEAK